MAGGSHLQRFNGVRLSDGVRPDQDGQNWIRLELKPLEVAEVGQRQGRDDHAGLAPIPPVGAYGRTGMMRYVYCSPSTDRSTPGFSGLEATNLSFSSSDDVIPSTRNA
jgi:hypothetical protein